MYYERGNPEYAVGDAQKSNAYKCSGGNYVCY